MHASRATPCGARHDTQTARIPTVAQDNFRTSARIGAHDQCALYQLSLYTPSTPNCLLLRQRKHTPDPAMRFDDFIAAPARALLTHLALPHFVGVPPAVHEVPSTAAPRLSVLDDSPGLAAALAPGRPLRCTTAYDPQHCSAR